MEFKSNGHLQDELKKAKHNLFILTVLTCVLGLLIALAVAFLVCVYKHNGKLTYKQNLTRPYKKVNSLGFTANELRSASNIRLLYIADKKTK